MEGTYQKVKKYISNIFLRYLMATELYMVEPWELVVVHILLGMLFAVFWYFNYSMVVMKSQDIGLSKSFLEEVL